jgi:asparagine synthase (glutamine-hydrolysing)
MGADELFGGYRKHYAALLAARYRRLPRVLRHGIVAPAVHRLPVADRP